MLSQFFFAIAYGHFTSSRAPDIAGRRDIRFHVVLLIGQKLAVTLTYCFEPIINVIVRTYNKLIQLF